MRIFVYEFITGGGTLGDDAAAANFAALAVEGRAMLEAVASDFASLPGVEVTTLLDPRCEHVALGGVLTTTVSDATDHARQFERLASAADRALLIAPETDRHLLRLVQLAQQYGCQLLGPDEDFIALAGDKHLLCEHLAAREVPVPQGVALTAGSRLPVGFPYPAVLKPRDGAGSQRMASVASVDSSIALSSKVEARLEVFSPGLPVSVLLLCGPGCLTALPPCQQFLSDEGRFTYRGGSLPIEPALTARATDLASQAMAALPAARGFVGVDLVLGDDPSGAGDVVIEVNPRLTTSYVGLRAALDCNLAAACLAKLAGEDIDLPNPMPVEFAPGGEIHRVDGTGRRSK